MKIILYHNVIAPYRHALFTALSEHVELEVWYAQRLSSDRQWRVKLNDQYSWVELHALDINVGRSIIITPRLEKRLSEASPAAVVSVFSRPNVLDTVRIACWCRANSVPLIGWVGDVDCPQTDIGFVKRTADRLRLRALSKASGFWSYSRDTDAWLDKQGLRQHRVTGTQALGDPVMQPRITPRDEREPVKLLYVGKLEERKGITTLVSALKKLGATDRQKVQFCLAGSGGQAEYIKSALSGLVNTEFLGFVDRDRLPEQYANADLLILPSHSDPWGFVVNEAMATGTPAIVSDRCGARELVERGGWVFPAGNSDALAATISEAIHTCRSHSLRQAAVHAESEYRADATAIRLAAFTKEIVARMYDAD